MAHFADRLIAAIKKKGNPVCVGLDPRLAQIPQFIKDAHTKEMGFTLEAAAHSIVEFNQGIIDAVADHVPCVKPQVAFYEQYGFEGMWAYEKTIEYAKDKGLLVIADAKRNDIGSTAQAYADGIIGQVDVFGGKYFVTDADAVTITPYLGADGILPFTKAAKEFGKGTFILVKTSNPSSGDFQDRELKGEDMTMYELVANFVESWGFDDIGDSGYSSTGAVVGATYPAQAEKLRKLMPHSIFLVPGYGAQGGTAEDVKPCFNDDGLGAVVNSSRGIIFAYEKNDADERAYAEEAQKAAMAMADDLKTVL